MARIPIFAHTSHLLCFCDARQTEHNTIHLRIASERFNSTQIPCQAKSCEVVFSEGGYFNKQRVAPDQTLLL
jgi:hypothetical protein